MTLVQSPIDFDPTWAPLSDSTCTAEMNLVNISPRIAVLQLLQAVASSVSGNQTILTYDTAEIADLFGVAIVPAAGNLSQKMTFDLSMLSAEELQEEVIVYVSVLGSGSRGTPIHFSGTLACRPK